MRWTYENYYDDLIGSAATEHGVDADLIKAVIGHESGFDKKAIGDDGASLGLMQVQKRTAEGEGVYGDLTDPATNIEAGTSYLAKMIAQFGTDGGISAYNGGPRPQLGFGQPLRSGQFRNQAYVDAVKRNWTYFRNLHGPVSDATSDAGAISPALHLSLTAGFLAVLGALAWLLLRH